MEKPEQIFANDMRTEGWKFFKEKGFQFFIKSTSGYVTTYYLYIAKSREELNAYFKNNNQTGYVENCYNVEELLKIFKRQSRTGFLPKNILSEKDSQNLYTEFFQHCYQTMPQYQKMLLGEYSSFHKDKSLSKEDYFFHIIEKIAADTKEKISTILKFPISVLDLRHIPIQNIENYLVKHQANKKEVDKFLLSYFKTRKNQLKDAKLGPIMRDYLLTKYSYHSDQLKLYSTFFPAVQAMFEIPKADFVLNKEPISTVIIVSAKKMKTSFVLDNWNVENYAAVLRVLSKGFQHHYGLDRMFVENVDKVDKTYQIMFLHNNKEFTKDIFEQDIVQYFQYLYDQKIEYKSVNEVHFSNWLSKKSLYNDLEQLEEKSALPKKNKI